MEPTALLGLGLVALSLMTAKGSPAKRPSKTPTTPAGAPLPALPAVKGIELTSADFRRQVFALAGELGMHAADLFLIMAFETAGTFDPAIRNPKSGAVGLLQFMPDTARTLGTSSAALAAMTAADQLVYVRAYFRRFRPLTTLEDAYMAVLWPKAIGTGRAHVLFSAGSIEYDQNRGLDLDRDGAVTVGEATERVRQMEHGEASPALRRVLLVGDSLAVGLRAPLSTLAHRAGVELGARARNSTTIDEWARGHELAEGLAQVAPTITAICLGTNDMLTNDIEAKRPHVRAIVDRVLGAGSAVAWLEPPEPMPFPDRGVRALLVDELARRNVRLMRSEGLDLERAPDHVHLTGRGYAAWATVIADWLPL